jgi:Tfp pilus assembly protein PilF
LGIVSITLTYLITRNCIADKRGERAALAAGALQALYPSMLFFEAELLVDFQFVTLLQAAIYTFQRATNEERIQIRKLAIAGALLGLAALTRATALALVPLFLWYLWRNLKPQSFGSRFTELRKPALALLAALTVTIAPVTLRNYLVSGDFTLIASSGGINFFIGNHAGADPVGATLPEPLGASWTIADMRGEAERAAGRRLSDNEVSAHWRSRGFDWIVSQPLDFVLHYSHKIYLLLSNKPYSNNRALDSVFAANPLLRLSPLNFSVLLTLAALGIFWRNRRSAESQVLIRTLGFAVFYSLVLGLFFVNERFRLPVLALLFPAAGLGLAGLLSLLIKRWNDDRPQPILPAALLALGCLALTLASYGRPTERSEAREMYLRANQLLRTGELAQARELYQQTLLVAPDYPRAHLNLGVIFYRESEGDSARAHFQRELQVYPGQPDALTNLASLELSATNLNLANLLSEQAYHSRPYDLTTVRIRMRTLAALRESDALEQLVDSSASRFEDELRYWYEVGLAALENSNGIMADSALRRAASIDPNSIGSIEASQVGYTNVAAAKIELRQIAAKAHYRLGYLAGVSGDLPAALNFSKRAIELDSTLIPAYVNLGLAYYSLGFVDSARSVYEKALIIQPAGGSAAEQINSLGQLLQ